MYVLLLLLQAVYTVLREAEYRSTAFVPYWRIPLARLIIPRQRRCTASLKIINSTLDGLVAKSQSLVSAQSTCRTLAEMVDYAAVWLNQDMPVEYTKQCRRVMLLADTT